MGRHFPWRSGDGEGCDCVPDGEDGMHKGLRVRGPEV